MPAPQAPKGCRLRISLRTNVKNGMADVVIIDSKGEAAKELERAKVLETNIFAPK